METQTLTTHDLRSFVRELELPPLDMVHVGRRGVRPMLLGGPSLIDGVPTADPSKVSGFVNDGSLVSFIAGVGPQIQADVLNSTLLAQLAANKQYDREKDTRNWYKFYGNVLQKVGWVVQEFQFQEYDLSGATASIDQVVIAVLTAIASENEMAAVKAMLDAASKLSNAKDNRLMLFDHSSHGQRGGSFQISSVVESGGHAAMATGAFYFDSQETVDRVLWFSFSSSNSSIYKSGQKLTLNPDAYAQVRSAVVTKLGDSAKNFVADIEI